MDIQTLHLFTHLARTLHFGRTSRACNITPSALTRRIQRIEAELGRQLFIRDNRSVALTASGQLFLEYARDVLTRQERLLDDLADNREIGGTLSMYCSVTAAYSILPVLFRRFRDDHPGVQIKLQTGDAALALASLQNLEADITIAALPRNLPGQVKYHKLFETPLVCIVSASFADIVQYRAGGIDWQSTPIIMPDRGLSRQRIERWFAERKIVPDVYANVAGNEAIIAMVSLGCGVGVVPLLVLQKSPIRQEIVIVEPAPSLRPFSIGVCIMKKKRQAPQVQAFWEIATANTGNLVSGEEFS